MSVSAADCGASRERCRNEDVEVHEFSAESCTVCIRCGLMLGRHIDLLVSQVPLVQPILEGMAHLTVAGLRNQAIGALSLCKHALQAAVAGTQFAATAPMVLLVTPNLWCPMSFVLW